MGPNKNYPTMQYIQKHHKHVNLAERCLHCLIFRAQTCSSSRETMYSIWLQNTTKHLCRFQWKGNESVWA